MSSTFAAVSNRLFALISVVAGIIYFQNNRLNETIKQLHVEQSKTRRLIYDAAMNAIQNAYDEKNYDLAFELLWQNVANSERGFEWGYWYRKTAYPLTLKGHSRPVTSVAISTDGKRIVTGSRDNTARIWDAETGKELRKLEGHSGPVYSVAISTDGKRIVTGSDDNMARIWEAETGKELKKLEGHSSPVYSVAISTDGKRIVTGSLDKTARIWEAETGKELRKLEGHSGPVLSVAISTDGKHIVTGSLDKTARIWDAETGKELSKLEGHGRPVTSVAISTDGKRIVTGSNDKTAILWLSTSLQEFRRGATNSFRVQQCNHDESLEFEGAR